ncbi:hypothetical protein [Paenibacillus sp. FSL K6-0108]|uniref:hypothetical protein n=1 Tax=Paenibacillus sp. FSL K6-0108 TaxID=2921417 RepID=UPI00325479C4
MQNIVPIQITFQAVNATDIKNLVHDLAGTLGSMPNADVPAQTTVSTVPTQPAPTQTSTQAPVQQPPQQPQYGQQPGYGQQPQHDMQPLTKGGYAQVPQQPQYGQQPPVQGQPVQQQPQFGQPDQQQYGQPQPPQQGSVPTTAPAYTLDQLGVAAQPVMDAGKGQELLGWLQQQGVGGLTQLDPSKYGEFATFLRSLGGRI